MDAESEYYCAMCNEPARKNADGTWTHASPLNPNEHEVVPVNEKGEWQG